MFFEMTFSFVKRLPKKSFILCSILICWGLINVKAAEPSDALKLAQQLNQAFVEVAEKVSKSVVVVRVAKNPGAGSQMDGQFRNSPFFDQLPEDMRKFFQQPERLEPPQRPRSREPIFDGQGSGLVYREDGIIMTNRHVIEGADKVKIVFKDGREFDGEVLGVDRESDIGVVKIDATGLTPAKLGDSSKTKVGEFAIAIGSPFELNYSVTVGHVSAKGRARVLQEKTKNVHAWIEGDLGNYPTNASVRRRAYWLKWLAKERGGFEFKPVTYNPYKYDCFVFKETEDSISSSPAVIISPLGVYAWDDIY